MRLDSKHIGDNHDAIWYKGLEYFQILIPEEKSLLRYNYIVFVDWKAEYLGVLFAGLYCCAFSLFSLRVSLNFSCWSWITILISASQVDEIMGPCHHIQLYNIFWCLFLSNLCTDPKLSQLKSTRGFLFYNDKIIQNNFKFHMEKQKI